MDLIVKDGLLTAVSVIDGGPAARAGLKPDDHIIKINGQMVRNLTTQEAARRFQGAPSTAFKLQVIRSSEVKPLDLTVTLEPLGAGTPSPPVTWTTPSLMCASVISTMKPRLSWPRR